MNGKKRDDEMDRRKALILLSMANALTNMSFLMGITIRVIDTVSMSLEKHSLLEF